uniref:TonB-dependent receptor n=1 Tax=uncultured bacterium 5H7 TaxID=1701327 RepID=A0A0N9HQN3_9BACT|nr:TonB-dependent receptor [uncultured bacterium 5H7]
MRRLTLQSALFCGAALVSLTISTKGYAQAAASVEDPKAPNPSTARPSDSPAALPAIDADASTDDIVVTGTLIRGIAPSGANVIGVSKEQIQATGANTTNELLGKLPQNGTQFLSLIQPGSGFNSANSVVPINRPNIRGLPGGNTAGGATTLVLIDGHRVVGAGLGQVAVDPDVIPPGALERVEVIADGSSAVYGSDAVGGVINFITRKRFDGVLAEGRIGFADDYTAYTANLTAGREWSTGSLWAAYNYSSHGAIFGSDRAEVDGINYQNGLGASRQCDIANITTSSGTRTFAQPSRVLGTFNACDATDDATIIGSERQHHVLVGLNQEIGDRVTLDVRAYYTNRYNETNGGPFRSSLNVTSANPNYINLGGVDNNVQQAVSFSYGPVLGNSSQKFRTYLSTWNVTPSVSIDLGSGWQARALFNYGRGFTKYVNDQVNTQAQTAALNAGTLNPYNVSASTPAAIASITGQNVGMAHHEFTNARMVADGPLVTLPGGEVRVAVGGEYGRTSYRQQTTNTTLLAFALNPEVSYTQTVKSVFGEVQVPLFSDENAMPLMQALNFSVSGRYDHYSDFGGTFNPKIGVTWKPISWISFSGNWGKSFTAPSPTDQLGVQVATSLVQQGTPPSFPNGATLNPAPAAGQTAYNFVLLRGAVAGLKPQSSVNWSIGTKIEPPFIPGLSLSATYYFIHFKDQIASPNNAVDIQPFFRNFPNLVTVSPSYAQLLALAQQVSGGEANLKANIPNVELANQPGGPIVVSMYDIRTRNLGVTRISGIDFGMNYIHDVKWGSIDASFNGNIRTMQTSQPSPTSAITDGLLTGTPKFRYTGTLGTTIGNLRAQMTMQFNSGFDVVPTANNLNTRHIDSYTSVDLYFRYDVKGENWGRNLAFTLNVNNVMDQYSPLLFTNTGASPANGATIGRFVQLGISKRF